MPTPLHNIVAQKIRESGPMPLDIYMELCLTHPTYGYYMTRDPFGVAGDFTTSPEISQLFGEMIGIWAADLWIKMGEPERITLLECGPGRGTLMADAMAATRHVTGFHRAAQVTLMEISPVLRKMQSASLSTYAPRWIESFDELEGAPFILIGNEFLDALPVRQFVFHKGEWREKAVDIADNDTLCLALLNGDFTSLSSLMRSEINHIDGTVVEVSPSIDDFLRKVNIVLNTHTGAALFCDYGYTKTAPADTLQALRSHRFVSVLESPGECDLTAHVDFENIDRLAGADGIYMSGPVSQSAWLENMGVRRRAANLSAKATERQARDIDSGLHRLIDLNGMGGLFKVCALCHDGQIDLAGFHEDISG